MKISAVISMALVLPGLAAAQEGNPAPPPVAAASGPDITTAVTAIIALGVIVGLGASVVYARRRLEEQRLREEMAERQFEMEVLGAIGELAPQAYGTSYSAAGTAVGSLETQRLYSSEPFPENGEIPVVASPMPAEAVAAVAAPSAPPSPAPGFAPAAVQTQQVAPSPAPLSPYLQPDTSQERADVTAAAVLSQLRHAGLIADTDGYMELNGNPCGAIILKLKDSRRALLVPYHESEVFIRRNLKRFDLLLLMGRDGKAVVVSSLENMIAERVASRF